MEGTLTIDVNKNGLWSLRNVCLTRRSETFMRFGGRAARKAVRTFQRLSGIHFQLNSKGSTVVAAFLGLRFFAVSDCDEPG